MSYIFFGHAIHNLFAYTKSIAYEAYRPTNHKTYRHYQTFLLQYLSVGKVFEGQKV